jgi:hypothetical protein
MSSWSTPTRRTERARSPIQNPSESPACTMSGRSDHRPARGIVPRRTPHACPTCLPHRMGSRSVRNPPQLQI